MSDNRETILLLELYSKPECCLCDEAKEVIDEVLASFPSRVQKKISLKTIDISCNIALLKKFGEDIPLLFLNGDKAFRYRVHPVTLKKKIEKALS